MYNIYVASQYRNAVTGHFIGLDNYKNIATFSKGESFYDDNFGINSCKLTLEKNKKDLFSFNVKEDFLKFTSYKEDLLLFTSVIVEEVVDEDSQVLFNGRIVEVVNNYNGEVTVYCEGGLASLEYCDCPPYDFNVGIYQYIDKFINLNNANANINGTKFDKLFWEKGYIHHEGGNINFIRSSSDPKNAYAEFTEKLADEGMFFLDTTIEKIPDNAIGGIMKEYTINAKVTINFTDEYLGFNDLVLRYGENITKISQTQDIYDSYTSIAFYGETVQAKSQLEGDYIHKTLTVLDKDYHVQSEADARVKKELAKYSKTKKTIKVEGIPYDKKGMLISINKMIRVEAPFSNITGDYGIEKMTIDLFNPASNKIELTKIR